MMYSIHFLPAGPNLCSHTQNLGACRGDAANYSKGRFQIPTDLNNPNGAIPTTALIFTVVYFKFGYNHNLNSTRSPTYKVKFDNNSNKWSCTCPDFTERRVHMNTCCKHIQGCIDLRDNFNRFNDLSYLDLLSSHIHQQ
jgi:hypothetical protein